MAEAVLRVTARAWARERAGALAFAAVMTFLIAWDGMLTMSFTDYEQEAEPSLLALRAGHVAHFLSHLPAYGGSLIMRAPFALLPSLWDGGDLALFRVVALPCLLAAVALGLYLFSQLMRGGRAGAAWLALGLCVANPLTLRALEIGHPEELLGAVLCTAAVIAALRDRGVLAGVLLGLAIANKEWAVLAVGPVLLALERDRRRSLLVAAAVSGVVLAPMLAAPLLFRGASVTSITGASVHTGAIFQPWQLWWFLGDHGHLVRGLYNVKVGYRAAPSWIGGLPHPLIALTPIPLSLLWARRRRPDGRRSVAAPEGSDGGRRGDALLLLALLMLLRCLLDTWDTMYYALPFVMALVSWEAVARRRVPWLAAVVTVGLWVVFELVPPIASPDLQSLSYLIPVLALLAGLLARLYLPDAWRRLLTPLGRMLAHRLPTLARAAGWPDSAVAE
jgi:Glycosyltransferase family 87